MKRSPSATATRGAVSTSWMPIASPFAHAVERVIAIVEQIARQLVPRKRLAQLLGRLTRYTLAA